MVAGWLEMDSTASPACEPNSIGFAPKRVSSLILESSGSFSHCAAMIGADTTFLVQLEIENYLLHPQALMRFVAGPDPDLLSTVRRKNGEDFLKDNFPPPALKNPLKESDYLVSTAASKSILPDFLEKTEAQLSKKDFFQIAAQMKPEEIHPEVGAKLDAMIPILNEERLANSRGEPNAP